MTASPGKQLLVALDELRAARRQVTAGQVAVSDLADMAADGVGLYLSARDGMVRFPRCEPTVTRSGAGGSCPVRLAFDRVGDVVRMADSGGVDPGRVEALDEEITVAYLDARACIEQIGVALRDLAERVR